MNSFNKLSLKNKVIVSMLPFVAAILLLTIFVYRSGFTEDDRLEVMNKAYMNMVKQRALSSAMSEAFSQYIVNPKNSEALSRKESADAQGEKVLKDFVDLVKGHYPELANWSEKVGKFDSNEMMKVENQLLEMVKNNDPKIKDYFTDKYISTRADQRKLNDQFFEDVLKHQERLSKQLDQEKRASTVWTLLILWVGVFVGFSFLMIIGTKVSKEAEMTFGSIYEMAKLLDNSSKHLTDYSNKLSEGVQEEAAAIQQTAASIDEVSAMVNRNSENAGSSQVSSGESKEAANEGRTEVQSMSDAIQEITNSNEQIMKQIEESNNQIGEIVKMISEIGSKTKVINDIVFQTKLLSFNASIEAARAGEHGKGFAVVAEEVGNLAQMSGTASKEISVLLDDSIKKVQGIVNDTKVRVEHLISLGKEKVETGSVKAQSCSQALDNILISVDKVDVLISEIAKATGEQAQGVSEIGKAMNQLSHVTQQNSVIAQKASQEASTIYDYSARLTDTVDKLVELLNGATNTGNTKPLPALSSQNKPVHHNKVEDIKKKSRIEKTVQKSVSQKPDESKMKDNVVSIQEASSKKSLMSKIKERKVTSTHGQAKEAVGGGSMVPHSNDPRFEEV